MDAFRGFVQKFGVGGVGGGDGGHGRPRFGSMTYVLSTNILNKGSWQRQHNRKVHRLPSRDPNGTTDIHATASTSTFPSQSPSLRKRNSPVCPVRSPCII